MINAWGDRNHIYPELIFPHYVHESNYPTISTNMYRYYVSIKITGRWAAAILLGMWWCFMTKLRKRPKSSNIFGLHLKEFLSLHTPLIGVFKRPRWVDCHDFEANLFYIVPEQWGLQSETLSTNNTPPHTKKTKKHFSHKWMSLAFNNHCHIIWDDREFGAKKKKK